MTAALTGLWVLLWGFLLEPMSAEAHTMFVAGIIVPCVPFVLAGRRS